MDRTRFEHLAAAPALRLLVAGDTHANAAWVEHLGVLAARHRCDLILQVGDFGFDPASEQGTAFLDHAAATCAEHAVELWWIDGNHENHTEIGRLHRRAGLPVTVRPRVRHLPRGLRLTLAGRRFGFLGGAFSVDWRSRLPGVSWWPNEIPTEHDAERLGAAPLDVLVCHDAPAGVDIPSPWRLPAVDRYRAEEVRDLLRGVVEATCPRLVLHGHWHHRHTTELPWLDADALVQGELEWRSTMVEGLDADGTVGGVVVLDLPSLAVTSVDVGGDRGERGASRFPVPRRARELS